MKALSQQICEIQDALTAKKISFREAVKPTKSEEQRLSVLKSLLADNGIKESSVIEIVESARNRKITRNNGSGIQPTADEKITERVKAYAKKLKCSIEEAHLYITGQKYQKPEIAEKHAAWRRYCPILRPEEIASLVERGVPIPN
jgi:hypothetical protein